MKFKTFCAANSGDGFISFFDTLLDEKNKKIFYIKGGPGSGKSTLMNQIAEKTDSAELIHCSGDPSSLDGVILHKENAVIIDATSPHSHEPQYPGVGGNLIDLGLGWDPQKMNKERIIFLSDHKKKLYNECYSLLNSAKSMHNSVFTSLMDHTAINKLRQLGDKILRQNALWEYCKQSATVSKRFISAISPEGLLTLEDPILKCGKNVIMLEDRWMISPLLLSYLHQMLLKRGIDHLCSYHPLLGKNTIHHLIIPQAHLSIITKDPYFIPQLPEENIVRKIALQNAIDKDFLDSHKNKFGFIRKLEKELLLLAVERLEEAKATHMEIEAEYSLGTDYKATTYIKENLISKLFS